jgi:hypothetical protein
VTFGGQASDITSGRYPNGTGPFVLMEPTPEAFNSGKRLSVNEVTAAEIKVFPNPANNRLFVESDVAGTIEIINSQGQVLLKDKATKGLSEYDIGNFQTGIYFVILHNNQIVINKKLLKL